LVARQGRRNYLVSLGVKRQAQDDSLAEYAMDPATEEAWAKNRRAYFVVHYVDNTRLGGP
jgi:hypothetical protein